MHDLPHRSRFKCLLSNSGMGIADPSISQAISTRNGVRTHVGAVMGGGTSIGLGIYIEEPWSFFEYLNRKYNAGWDEAVFRKVSRGRSNQPPYDAADSY